MINHSPFLATLGFLLVLLSCSNEEKKVPEATPLKPEIFNDGLQINYSTCGEADTTLFFLHGWCINQTYWQQQVDAFCENYHIVTMDLAGFGNSGKNRADWTIEEYAADAATVIDSLGLKNVILIGHSMSGDVILETALSIPEKVIALVGVDNFKDVGVPVTEEVQAEIDGFVEILRSNYQQTVAGYGNSFLFHESTDSLVKQRIITDFVNADSTVAIGSLIELFEYGKKESDKLGALKQKLYLINSDASPTNTDGLDATGVHYEVLDIPATGHYPMVEKPALFNQLLKEVLDKV